MWWLVVLIDLVLSQAYRDKEERLVATAFYDLGMKLNRGAVENRLANLSQVGDHTPLILG